MRLVRILLSTRLDYMPSPAGMRLASLPGPAPGKEVPCETCQRLGKVKRGLRVTLCPSCNGRRWRKRRRGDPKYDSYTRDKVSDEQKGTVSVMSSRDMDRQLSEISIDLAIREGTSESVESQPSALDRRNQNGSYEELERALSWLSGSHPTLSRILSLVYDQGLISKDRLTYHGQVLETLAVAMLAGRMRGKILLPRHEYRKLKQERADSVARLVRLKVSIPDIAARLLLSERYVKQFVKK